MSKIPDITEISTAMLRERLSDGQIKSSSKKSGGSNQITVSTEELDAFVNMKIASALQQRDVALTEAQRRHQKLSAYQQEIRQAADFTLEKIAQAGFWYYLENLLPETFEKVSAEQRKAIKEFMRKASEAGEAMVDKMVEGDAAQQVALDKAIDEAAVDPEAAAEMIAELTEDEITPEQFDELTNEGASTMIMGEDDEMSKSEDYEKKSSAFRKFSSSCSPITRELVVRGSQYKYSMAHQAYAAQRG